jgi:molybdopterin molybdotransferase
MTRPLADDCFVIDRPRLTHAEAIDVLRRRVTPVADFETVSLSAAAGRLIAGAVTAERDVPADTNAAVDGYAFAFGDYDADRGSTVPLSGRVAAGANGLANAEPGAAVRIFTGGVLPAGVDTCVMQEDCRLSEDLRRVNIPARLKRGANVRKAGEDVRIGTVLFETGARLRAQDIAALASLGHTHVDVFAQLRVGMLSSGNELAAPGVRLQRGQVYDANRPMLSALIETAGARVVDLGHVADNRADVETRLRDAVTRCDLVITTGGASKGEEDHLAPAIESLGTRHLWQIAVKPGRPLSFGLIEGTPVLGLPGNPVAVFVCFLLYGWPLVRRLAGGTWPEPHVYELPAAFTFTGRKTGRREYWRGRLVPQPDGRLAVEKFARDGSGLITGLREADGLIEIPEAAGDVHPGDHLRFIPFSNYGLLR